MIASIAHRLTGIVLYSGTLLVTLWMLAAASGPVTYAWINSFLSSWLGQLILIGYTWALMQHLLGGLRHLIWDTGRLMEKRKANALAYITFIGSAVLTFSIWITALLVR